MGGAQCLNVQQIKAQNTKSHLQPGEDGGAGTGGADNRSEVGESRTTRCCPWEKKQEHSINLTKSALALYFVFQVSSLTRDDLGVGWGGGWRVSRWTWDGSLASTGLYSHSLVFVFVCVSVFVFVFLPFLLSSSLSMFLSLFLLTLSLWVFLYLSLFCFLFPHPCHCIVIDWMYQPCW